jgi:putative oxidoreductase
MKIAANFAGGLLGFIFVLFSLLFFVHPPHPRAPLAGSPMTQSSHVTEISNSQVFTEICELIGGCLVAIPRTRNLGILVLAPGIVSTLFFCTMTGKWGLLFGGRAILASILTVFIVWVERRAFAHLLDHVSFRIRD